MNTVSKEDLKIKRLQLKKPIKKIKISGDQKSKVQVRQIKKTFFTLHTPIITSSFCVANFHKTSCLQQHSFTCFHSVCARTSGTLSQGCDHCQTGQALHLEAVLVKDLLSHPHGCLLHSYPFNQEGQLHVFSMLLAIFYVWH